MLFNSVFTILWDFNIQCRVCYTACSVNRRETVSLFKFPIKSLMIPFELNWPVSLITIYILYVIITPPILPTVSSSSYHQEDGTGASEPRAYSTRLWDPTCFEKKRRCYTMVNMPCILRPVAGIKLKWANFVHKTLKFLSLNKCYVIYVLLWTKYWLMWFKILLVFIL